MLKLFQPELKLIIFYFSQVASINKRNSYVLSATLLLVFHWVLSMVLKNCLLCLNNTIYLTSSMVHYSTPMPPKLKGYPCYKTIFCHNVALDAQ